MPTWVEIVKRGLPDPNVDEDAGVSKEQEYEDRFGHLEHEFTTGWEDTYDSLTPGVIDEYWKDMFSYMNSFNYEDGENCGSIPKSYAKNGLNLLISSTQLMHLRAMIQSAKRYSTISMIEIVVLHRHFYTRLPIYTCRDEQIVI